MLNRSISPNNIQFRVGGNQIPSPSKLQNPQIGQQSPYNPYMSKLGPVDRSSVMNQQSNFQYVPLNFEPHNGTQTILRPVGYETTYVPINDDPSLMNIQPTLPVNNQPVRQFSPPQIINPNQSFNPYHHNNYAKMQTQPQSTNSIIYDQKSNTQFKQPNFQQNKSNERTNYQRQQNSTLRPSYDPYRESQEYVRPTQSSKELQMVENYQREPLKQENRKKDYNRFDQYLNEQSKDKQDNQKPEQKQQRREISRFEQQKPQELRNNRVDQQLPKDIQQQQDQQRQVYPEQRNKFDQQEQQRQSYPEQRANTQNQEQYNSDNKRPQKFEQPKIDSQKNNNQRPENDVQKIPQKQKPSQNGLPEETIEIIEPEQNYDYKSQQKSSGFYPSDQKISPEQIPIQRNHSIQDLGIDPELQSGGDSDIKIVSKKPEDEFKRRIQELSKELYDKGHDILNRTQSQQILRQNERTRHTDKELSRSEDYRIQELEDKLVLYERELSHWKQKFNDIQNEKRRITDELINRYEENTRIQIQTMTLNNTQKLKELANEIQQLQSQNTQAINESEKWRRKAHELEMQQFELKTKTVDAEAQKEILQKDLNRIQSQYHKLKYDYESKQAENEIRIKQIPKETDIQRLQDTIELREREIEDLKIRNSQLEMLCVEIKKLDTVNHELNHQLQIQTQQNYLQNDTQDKLEKLLEDERLKNKKFQEQIRNINQQTRRETSLREEELLQEIDRLTSLINEKNNQLNQQQILIEDLKQQLMKVQQIMAKMKSDYEHELDQMGDKKSIHEQEFRDNIEKKFQLLKKEIDQLQQERSQLLGEIQQLQQQKLFNNSKNQQVQAECEHLNNVLKQKNQEINNLKQHCDQLSEQLENFQQEMNELNYQLQDNQRPATQPQNIDQNEYLDLIVLQCAEIDAIRSRLDQYEAISSGDPRSSGQRTEQFRGSSFAPKLSKFD